MKSLKILSLCLGIFFLAAHNCLAQDQAAKMSDEQKAQMAQNMEAFFDVLDLSDEQKTEFKAISQKYAKQMISVRDSDSSKMSKYKKVKSIRKNRNAEMKKVLTEEQYDAYLVKQEEIQKKMRERRG